MRRADSTTWCRYDADLAIVATKGLRHRRRDRDAARGDPAPREVRVSSRRRTASATKKNSPRRSAPTTSSRRADRAGRSRSRRQRVGGQRPAASRSRRWARTRTTGCWPRSRAAGLHVKVVDDYRALKWSKLALNVVANATCAILNVLPERLVHFDEIFTLEIRDDSRSARRDEGDGDHADRPAALSRARAASVATLPSPLARAMLANRIAGARGTQSRRRCCSICARAKLQTEVDVLNGAVAAAGHEYGVPTPVNAVYCRVLERHRAHAAAVGEISRTPRSARRRSRSRDQAR